MKALLLLMKEPPPLDEGASRLNDGVVPLMNVSRILNKKVSLVDEGASHINEGVASLNEGAYPFTEGSSPLNEWVFSS